MSDYKAQHAVDAKISWRFLLLIVEIFYEVKFNLDGVLHCYLEKLTRIVLLFYQKFKLSNLQIFFVEQKPY